MSGHTSETSSSFKPFFHLTKSSNIWKYSFLLFYLLRYKHLEQLTEDELNGSRNIRRVAISFIDLNIKFYDSSFQRYQLDWHVFTGVYLVPIYFMNTLWFHYFFLFYIDVIKSNVHSTAIKANSVVSKGLTLIILLISHCRMNLFYYLEAVKNLSRNFIACYLFFTGDLILFVFCGHIYKLGSNGNVACIYIGLSQKYQGYIYVQMPAMDCHFVCILYIFRRNLQLDIILLVTG